MALQLLAVSAIGLASWKHPENLTLSHLHCEAAEASGSSLPLPIKVRYLHPPPSN